MGLAFLLLLAVSVKQDQTPLRASCEAGAATVAELPAGAPVTLGFSLSGECYKVSVELDGKTLQGYLQATALDGLENFDQGRRNAAWLEVTPPAPAPSSASTAPPKKDDPNGLAFAGLAALREDNPRQALEDWRAALAQRPNPDLEILYHRVEREVANDHSNEKLYGWKVMLRYDPAATPVEVARQMVRVLDSEFTRISTALGCYTQDRTVAIVQSREAYRKTTDAAEWAGGQYDGRIRVPMFDGEGLDANMRRTLAHEITHACLTSLGRWPSWLQEGLAQKMSGETLSPALEKKLEQWAKEGKLPRLSNLHQDWSRLDTEHAAAAYGISLQAVDLIEQTYGSDGIRNLLHSPERLDAITADLDRRLGL